MTPQTYNMIKMALTSDASISASDRRSILDFCKNPSASPAQSNTPSYYSPKSVAQKMNVSKRTVARWTTSGRLKSSLVGNNRRISQTDLDNFISGGGHKTTSDLDLHQKLRKAS